MSGMPGEKHLLMVRVPVPLIEALQVAAKDDLTTVSEHVRRLILRDVRERGLLLPEREDA